MPPDPAPAGLQLLTARDVGAALKLHVGSVWRMSAAAEAGLPCNGFPRPLRLSARVVRWRADDVRAYLDRLAAGEGRP